VRPATVEEYLAGVPEKPREALERLRCTIREAAPQAAEGMAYGVPAFIVNGKPLVCYAAFKNHCGFYPLDPDLIAAHAAVLGSFTTAKGTIRFTPERPLPGALVREMVRARLAQITGKQN